MCEESASGNCGPLMSLCVCVWIALQLTQLCPDKVISNMHIPLTHTLTHRSEIFQVIQLHKWLCFGYGPLTFPTGNWHVCQAAHTPLHTSRQKDTGDSWSMSKEWPHITSSHPRLLYLGFMPVWICSDILITSGLSFCFFCTSLLVTYWKIVPLKNQTSNPY